MTGENGAQKSIICCDPLHAGILAIHRLGYIHCFYPALIIKNLLGISHPQSKMNTFKNNHYQAVVNIFAPESGFYFAANEVT